MLVTSPWAFWLVCMGLVIDPIDAVTANTIVKTDPTSLDARPTLAKNWSSIVSKGSTVFSACTRIPGCGRTSISVHTVIPSLAFKSLKFLPIGSFRPFPSVLKTVSVWSDLHVNSPVIGRST